MIDIFDCSDYKDVLRRTIDEQAHTRGYQGRLAVAAKCQKSFMSQVLNGDAHLNLDQAALLSSFWKLDEPATEYFLTLVQEARATAKPLRHHLQKKRDLLRRKIVGPGASDPTKYELAPEHQLAFYSRWYTSGVYMLCGVKGCDEDAIAARLGVKRSHVEQELEFLIRVGLVEQLGKGRYRKRQTNMWLSDPTHLMGFRYGWRAVGARKLVIKEEEDLFYTSLFTLPKSDLVNLYAILSRAIREIKETTEKVQEEELICLNIDFFKV